MPIRIPAETLQQIIDLAKAVRKEGETRIDVTPDTIRFRALSEDLGTFLDLSIPATAPELTVEVNPASYWIEFDRIDTLLTSISNKELVIYLPDETLDSRFRFHVASLTYWKAPLDDLTAHRIFDEISAPAATTLSIQNSTFNLAVNVADLVGTALQVQFDHDTRHITFSAKNPGADSFTYAEPVQDIHTAHAATEELRISIDQLQEIVSNIPPTDTISIELTPNHLTYHSEYPTTGATLDVHIAEYKDTIS